MDIALRKTHFPVCVSFLYLIFCVLSIHLYFHWQFSGRKVIQFSHAKHKLPATEFILIYYIKILLFRFFFLIKSK